MPLTESTLAQLSVKNGNTTDRSSFISIDDANQLGLAGTESFFAILEPLVTDPNTEETAQVIIQRLQQELVTHAHQTPTAALSDAVETINEELHEYNSLQSEDRRLYYGLTCGISRDDDLYIAQVAPSQVLIGQDGELYAFPGLDSWHWSARFSDSADMEQPLGLHREIEPELYHTRLAAGDLIVLLSTSLARVIEREPQDVFVSGSAGNAIAHLERLTSDYAVSNATSAVIGVAAQPESARHRDHAFLRRMTTMFAAFLPEETADKLRGKTANPASSLDHEEQSGHNSADPAASAIGTADVPAANHSWQGSEDTVEFRFEDLHDTPELDDYDDSYEDVRQNTSTRTDTEYDAYWDHVIEADDEIPHSPDRKGRRTLTEILVGAFVALIAAIVGIWQLATNRERPIDDGRDESTLGLPRLQRYDQRVQGPDFTGLRRRLPRAPISRVTGFVSVGLIIAVASGLVFSIYSSRERERVETFESHIEESVHARQEANQESNPAAAAGLLDTAETELDQAAEINHDPERVSAERIAIAAARDEAFGIERMSNVQVLGGIPAAPAGVTPRVFFGNGQVYLISDALYRVDTESSQLVQLLAPGDTVGSVQVGTLLGATWSEGRPMAMDGSNLFVLDTTAGSWVQHEVGNFGQPYDTVADISSYIGNLYLLSQETGQIVSYPAGDFSAMPDDWTGGQAAEELSMAVDMEIDGRIYVQLEDGRFLDFYRGVLEETHEPEVHPAINGAVAMSIQPDRPYYYVADAEDRIIRITSEGEFVQQFMTAEDAPDIEGIRDIAVNDALGSAYVITDNSLIEAQLPPPPR